MELINLPSELLMTIFINLPLKDFLRCRQVCTRFQSLIGRDFRATYKLELAVAGMQDGPPSTLTTADRLSILQARQYAWSKFAWTGRENIPICQGHTWELYGNVLTQSEGERTFHFKQIPSLIRGIEGTEWTIPDVGCEFTDIGVDPSQNLLIVTEHFRDDRSELMCRIHLKALSTGTPHPARPREGTLTHKCKLRSYPHSIQTSNNHLGILTVCAESNSLVVWDWKIGTVPLHVTGPDITSWAFLTPRLLLVAQTVSRYNGENGSTVYIPHIVVIDLESAPSPNPVMLSEANCIRAFHYPHIADDAFITGMVIQSNPGPNSCPKPPPEVPFSVSSDPEHRLFLISLWAIVHTEEVVLRSLVPAATFLRALASLAPGETQRDFEWSEWGKRGSRLFSTPGSEVCNAYGTVMATTEVDSDTPDGRVRMTVTVRDFNQLAIRRHAVDPGLRGEEDEARIVTDATMMEPAGVFKDPVTTSLPYTERVLVLFQEEQDSWDEVIPTEDALVLATGTWNSRFRCRILSI